MTDLERRNRLTAFRFVSLCWFIRFRGYTGQLEVSRAMVEAEWERAKGVAK